MLHTARSLTEGIDGGTEEIMTGKGSCIEPPLSGANTRYSGCHVLLGWTSPRGRGHGPRPLTAGSFPSRQCLDITPGLDPLGRADESCPDTGPSPGVLSRHWAEPRSDVQTLGRAREWCPDTGPSPGVLSRHWAEPRSDVQTLGRAQGVVSRHWAEPRSDVQTLGRAQE